MIDDGSYCVRPSLLFSIHIKVNTNYDLAAMESGSIIIVRSINSSHFPHLTVLLLSPTALGNRVQRLQTTLSIDCALSPLAAQRGQCVTVRATAMKPLPPGWGQVEAATFIPSYITSLPCWTHRALWAARHFTTVRISCPLPPQSSHLAPSVKTRRKPASMQTMFKRKKKKVLLTAYRGYSGAQMN